MNKINQKLARLLARHPEFSWEPGMLVCQNWGSQRGLVSLRIKSEYDIKNWTQNEEETFPDLEDWATCGILLGMLTHATKDRTFTMIFNDPNFLEGSWILSGDQTEPFEIWDNFGGIIAASLLFVWNQEEPDL